MTEATKRTWAEVKFRKAKSEVFGRRHAPADQTRADVTHATTGTIAARQSFPRTTSSGPAVSGNPFPKALPHGHARPGIRFGTYDALKPKKAEQSTEEANDLEAYYARLAYEGAEAETVLSPMAGDKSHHGDTMGDKSNRRDMAGDNFFANSFAQVAVVSPTPGDKLLSPAAGATPTLAGVVTPCTLAAALQRKKLARRFLTHKIYFRVAKAEYEQKQAEAQAYGISIADWARTVFLAHRLPLARPSAEAVRDVLVAFSRVGNNLNQIARRANSGQEVGQEIGLIRQALKPVLDRFMRLQGLEP
jgi:hypothetical protein